MVRRICMSTDENGGTWPHYTILLNQGYYNVLAAIITKPGTPKRYVAEGRPILFVVI